MKRIVCAAVLGVMWLLSACQSFQREDTQATLQVDSNRYRTEAASLGEQAMARQTEVLAQAQAAETYVVSMNDINRQLLATVRANDPPTQAIFSGSSAQVGGTPIAGVQFAQTGTASEVRTEDDCPVGYQTEFAPTTPRIYMTGRAQSIQAGTRMSVQWTFGGSTVFDESWTVPRTDNDFCLWFYIEPSMVAFSPGQWAVQLFADGVPVAEPTAFTITDAMTEG